MKKRMLALVLAAVMVMTLLPVTAMAADAGTISQPTAGGTAFFANGTPITITAAAPEGGKAVSFGEGFTATGTSAYISWNQDGETVYVGVSDQVSVYGGSNGIQNAVVVPSTSITMTGGRIKYLYGGNQGAKDKLEESCSVVTGDVVMNISDHADVSWLLHGAGAGNTCVKGTVYMNFNNVDLSDMSDYLYVNGGGYGNG